MQTSPIVKIKTAKINKNTIYQNKVKQSKIKQDKVKQKKIMQNNIIQPKQNTPANKKRRTLPNNKNNNSGENLTNHQKRKSPFKQISLAKSNDCFGWTQFIEFVFSFLLTSLAELINKNENPSSNKFIWLN